MTISFWDPSVTADNPGPYEEFGIPVEWDRIKFGGTYMPGTAEVRASAEFKVDKTSANGTSGGRHRNTGYQPTKVEIKIHIWTPQQWDDFQPFIAKFWPSKKAAPTSSTAPTAASLAAAKATIASANASANEAVIAASGGAAFSFENALQAGVTGSSSVPLAPTAAVTPAQLAAAQKVIARSKSSKTPNAAPPPIDVSHPKLTLLGITAIEILGFSTPVKGASHQEKVFTIKAIEYLQPTKRNVTNPLASGDISVTDPQLQTSTARPQTANGALPRPSGSAAAIGP